MIPVEVPADARPVLASEIIFTIEPDHLLYGQPCPACGQPLSVTADVVLVLAGIAPENQKGSGYTAGGAVAVHAACAGVEPADEADHG